MVSPRLAFFSTLLGLLMCEMPCSADGPSNSSEPPQGSKLARVRQALEAGILEVNRQLEADPNNATLYVRRAIGHTACGRHKMAENDLEAALAIDPNNINAYGVRGKLFEAMGRSNEAIAAYSRTIELGVVGNGAYFFRARLFAGSGRLDEALRDLTKAIEIEPGDAVCLGLRAVVFRKLQKYPEALADIDAAIRGEPTQPTMRLVRALLLFENMGEKEKAIAELDETIRMFPDYADAYLARGKFLQQCGPLRVALADSNKAVELAPKNPQAHLLRADVRIDMNDFLGASTDVSTAMKLAPTLAGAGLLLRGKAFYRAGRVQTALRDLDESIAIMPDAAEAHYWRGAALLDLERFDKALAAFDRATQLAPRLVNGFVGRACLFSRQGLADEAKRELAQAVAINPAAALGIVDFAQREVDRKRPQSAIRDCDTVIAVDPNCAEAFALRAQAHEQLGHQEQAQEDQARAAALFAARPAGQDQRRR